MNETMLRSLVASYDRAPGIVLGILFAHQDAGNEVPQDLWIEYVCAGTTV